MKKNSIVRELKKDNPILSSREFRTWDSKLNWKIHERDGNVADDGLYYFKTGLDALMVILKALEMKGIDRSKISRILEYPCGYGRVTRWLNMYFNKSDMFSSDFDKLAVDFCMEEFNVKSFEANWDTTKLEFPDSLDLVWIGSMFTHIKGNKIIEILRLCTGNMKVGGLVIFTSHGFYVRNRLKSREKTYNLAEGDIDGLIEDYDSTGFGFRPYSPKDHRGISLINYDWMYKNIDRVPGMKILSFMPRGWVGHQDVFVLEKVN